MAQIPIVLVSDKSDKYLRGQANIDANFTELYTGLAGSVPSTRTVTINGVTFDLAANRTWNVGDMLKATYDPTGINASPFTRANHTGTQLAATVSDFNAAALAAAPPETTTTIGVITHAATNKITPVDADEVTGNDSASGFTLIRYTWTNIKAFLKTYFDTLYSGYSINLFSLSFLPVASQTVYFGHVARVPSQSTGLSKIYIRKAGTIKICELFCITDGEAGTNEAWSIYIRLNNTTDTLIATISAATNERNFTNSALSITVAAGDYIEIKSVNPAWVIVPVSVFFGGYIYIE